MYNKAKKRIIKRLQIAYLAGKHPDLKQAKKEIQELISDDANAIKLDEYLTDLEASQPGQLDVIIDFFEKQRQAMRDISGTVQCMNVVSKPGTDR